ncbi:hypothetical protein CDAR_10091 [Caerostris darwini]|uniref:Uncharacterized protein n=1 Tax=Caerostris darwini TaxID=1538125 RepID=A0AAV4WJK5_9ARAC|nr:hypothetical protein CDAR_10091 [Caerostris darwini]
MLMSSSSVFHLITFIPRPAILKILHPTHTPTPYSRVFIKELRNRVSLSSMSANCIWEKKFSTIAHVFVLKMVVRATLLRMICYGKERSYLLIQYRLHREW